MLIYNLKDNRSKFLNNDVCLSLKIVSILANSTDPDEMPHLSGTSSGYSLLAKEPVYGYPE